MKLKETRDCINFALKRTSRIVGRHYDDALRPFGLRVTQFNVLAVLGQVGPASHTELAKLLATERSAIARNLKPLVSRGFVSVQPGTDRRTRLVTISSRGRKNLLKALPAWAKAQNAIKKTFGEDNSERFTQLVRALGESLEFS